MQLDSPTPGEEGEITFYKSCNGASFAAIDSQVHSGSGYYGGGGGASSDYTIRPNDRICYSVTLWGGSVSSAPTSYVEFYLHISAFEGSISPFVGIPNNVCAYYS
jgi:hypothetical protein